MVMQNDHSNIDRMIEARNARLRKLKEAEGDRSRIEPEVNEAALCVTQIDLYTPKKKNQFTTDMYSEGMAQGVEKKK